MKLRSIQVLRAVAVLAVVLCHGADVGKGAAGVDLFFVISGFIMATVAPGRSPAEFLAARAWRIYPLYLLCLLPWLGVAYSLQLLTPAKLLASLTLWPIWGEFLRPALPAGWSLCYEMVFYLGTAAALRWGSRPVIVAYATTVAISLASPLLTFLGNVITVEFLAGAAIARFRPTLSAWWLVPAGAIFLFAADPMEIAIGQQLDRILYIGLPCALLVAIVVQYESSIGRAFNGLVFIGDASYSIYLTHQLILLWLWPAAVGILLVLIFGCAIHLGIERRLMKVRPRSALIWRKGAIG